MRGLILAVVSCLAGGAAMAQHQIHFQVNSAYQSYTLYEDDSIYFDASHTTLYFSNDGTVVQFAVADVENITFTTDNSKNITINYQGSTATVTNPLAGNGVEVTLTGAHVLVNSVTEEKDINIICSGTSTNGELKVYSESRYNILLNGLTLTNPTGPAINSQSEKKATLHLISGTTNTVSDGVSYATSTEDQKAAVFGEGKLEIVGGGSLTVNGLGADQHAIASDEDIELNEGTVTVSSAVKDGVHASEGVKVKGGTLTVSSTGDGIDAGGGTFEMNCGTVHVTSTSADVKAITCDSTFILDGGTIELTVSGAQSKGIKGGQNMFFNDGTITATTSGAAVLVAEGSGTEPSYSTLISCDSTVTFNGTQLTLTTTGAASRGISSDGNVVINEGTIVVTSSGNGTTYTNSSGVTDAYHGVCLRVNGNLSINGGNMTFTNSGKGGKGIDADGTITIGSGSTAPIVQVTTTGASITISSGGGGGGPGGSQGDYDESKAVKADGNITINSGTITVASADDGIKSDNTITINGGTITITNSTEGIEANFITINGGDVEVNSSDDALNASAGSGGESSDGSLLKIAGGYVYLNATGGDPLDSNGNISVTGGTTVVHGPQSSPEVGMDYNGTGLITGGFVVVSGTNSNMTQGFQAASSQRSLIIKSSQSIAANTIIHVEDASGNEIFTFKPVRSYYSVVFSSPLITAGTTYKVYTSGSSTGTLEDGLYTGGAYTAGTLKSTFTVNNVVTNVNF